MSLFAGLVAAVPYFSQTPFRLPSSRIRLYKTATPPTLGIARYFDIQLSLIRLLIAPTSQSVAQSDIGFWILVSTVMPPFLSHGARQLSSSSSSASSPSTLLLHRSLSLRSLASSVGHQITSHPVSSATISRRSLQPIVKSITSLVRRQQSAVNPNVLPTTYAGLNSGPAPGTVVGVVIGAVAGFLILLWLIYTCVYGPGYFYEEETVVRTSHSARRSSRSRSSMTQPRSSPRQQTRRETIIVEERRAPPVEDDIVEVIEERSPSRTPPRRDRRSSDRRDTDGYYRPVDPLAYGGGSAPPRKVHR